jgi:hypothetical protein
MPMALELAVDTALKFDFRKRLGLGGFNPARARPAGMTLRQAHTI